MSEQARDGWFVRAAARVGDLGSPFYAEEYRRDVWNEASAIGFQLVLWLLSLAAVVSVWVGGAPAVPYALVMFLVPGAASWVVLSYASAHGVDGATGSRKVLGWRVGVFVVLALALCAGVVRAMAGADLAPGLLTGLVVGALLGGLGVWWSKRRAAAGGA
ncbi:hypothetical protein ACUN7V_06105 [Quadrisphaera oryzae]|uniref:hypothetical protein n=1 Tax=Quadrisphaera TaxID=317661 RepID=UPI0016494E60|nr:hypothetical protein [Quadrisphaera sp. RL12-1S]MBC3764080.1 hypothetical protein [Quadrisphaera sp. RL12-1S]